MGASQKSRLCAGIPSDPSRLFLGRVTDRLFGSSGRAESLWFCQVDVCGRAATEDLGATSVPRPARGLRLDRLAYRNVIDLDGGLFGRSEPPPGSLTLLPGLYQRNTTMEGCVAPESVSGMCRTWRLA